VGCGNACSIGADVVSEPQALRKLTSNWLYFSL
jgi:hypothetical protein